MTAPNIVTAPNTADEPKRASLWETLAATVEQSVYLPDKFADYVKISPQHVPLFLLRVQGYTMREIGTLTGFSRFTVSSIFRCAAGQRLLSELFMELGRAEFGVVDSLKAASPEAIETLLDVMRGEKDDLRLKSAMAILDRAGYGAVQKAETTLRIEIPSEKAELLNAAINEAFDLGEGDFEIVVTEALDVDEPV